MHICDTTRKLVATERLQCRALASAACRGLSRVTYKALLLPPPAPTMAQCRPLVSTACLVLNLMSSVYPSFVPRNCGKYFRMLLRTSGVFKVKALPLTADKQS